MKSSMCTTTCDRGFHICCKECWVMDCDERCNLVINAAECKLMKKTED